MQRACAGRLKSNTFSGLLAPSPPELAGGFSSTNVQMYIYNLGGIGIGIGIRVHVLPFAHLWCGRREAGAEDGLALQPRCATPQR